jgi:tRNA A-37 threonylcarbamoyl transferase component Bud32
VAQRDDAFANTLITPAPAKAREGEDKGGAASSGAQPVRDLTSAEKIAGAEIVFGGRYEVQSRLGSGGFGVVYEAIDRRLQKRVAIKVLTRERTDDAQLLERFRGEALAAGKLHHPTIAGTTDFEITADGVAYLVMEFVDGESLDKIIRRDGPLSVRRAARIAHSLCRALAAAHGAGIVHRDLKPANIIVRREADGSEAPKVLDFGLAKLMQKRDDAALTDTGQMLGTPIYMAPEQIRGRADLDGRADIYSVGVILYEMLTAHTPFSTRSTGDVLVAKMIEKPERPTRYAAIPAPLEKLVLRAIEADPDKRPETAQELAAALELYTADSAMSGTGQLALPQKSRWKYMAIGGVAVAGLGLVGSLLLGRGEDGGEPPAPAPRPAAAAPAERAPTAHGGSDEAALPVPLTADVAPAAVTADAGPAASATVDSAPPARPGDATGTRRKRQRERPRDPGSLYDAPTGSLRLPR